MRCPRCGSEVPAAAECVRCGVVFARLAAAARRRPGAGRAHRPGRARLLVLVLGILVVLQIARRAHRAPAGTTPVAAARPSPSRSPLPPAPSPRQTASPLPSPTPAEPLAPPAPAVPPELDESTVTIALLRELESRRSLHPDDPALARDLGRAWSALGESARGAGRLDTAVRHFALALELLPDDERTLMRLAAAETAREQWPAARRALERVRGEARAGAAWHALMSEVHYAEDRLEEALAEMRVAAALSGERAHVERLRRLEREVGAANDRSLTSRRFQVSFRGAENRAAGRAVLEALEEAYDRLKLVFRTDDFTISAVLYGDEDYSVVTGAPDWSAALFDGKIRVPIAGLERIDEGFRKVLVHELAHAFVWRMGGPKVPRWLHEGLAQHAEGRRLADFDLRAAERARILRAEEPGDPRLFYAQALWRVEAMIARFSLGKVLGLLEDLRDGSSFEEALEDNARAEWGKLVVELGRSYPPERM